MLDALASVLWLVMEPCYGLVGNWWIAILLFTLVMKVILMPLSLWVQKNGIKMVCMMPEMNEVKVKYFGDKEVIGEKQNELYKKNGYHPFLGLIPLAVQILVLFGLIEVVRSISTSGAEGTQLLGLVPLSAGGALWLMPVLAGLSAVVQGLAQNHINPLQREQSSAEKRATNGLSIALSFFLGLAVPAGLAFYWICSNLTAIVVQLACNCIIKPGKYIDYEALAESRVLLDELNALDGHASLPRKERRRLAKREKSDYKRFFNIVGKHIVFYSEGSGFYRYFQGAIEYLLAHSDACIHYVTSDPNDQIFGIAERSSRIKPYYIGEKRLITLMMKMDASIVVMSLHGLGNHHLKRSYVKKDAEYVFMFHHMTSTHLVSHKGSFDNYDTVLCAGQHQIDELRRAEELYGTPPKKLVACGYDLLDRGIATYDAKPKTVHEVPVVMVAPSWQEDCILDSCIDDLLESLLGKGFSVVVRPHPEYVKRYRPRWESIQAKYAHVPEGELCFEQDFSSNSSVFDSDVLITDWSSVAHEFSFSTLKPSVFVDTPMKVNNPDYGLYGMVPTDISTRNEIGVSFSPSKLGDLGTVVEGMLADQEGWRDRIREVRSRMIFNLGVGGEVAGEYLLSAILAKQDAIDEAVSTPAESVTLAEAAEECDGLVAG